MGRTDRESATRFRMLGAIVAIGGILSLSALHGYLFFHSLVEIFSVVIAAGIFMVTWNTRQIIDNHYFLVIGVASLFVGGIDLLHALSYEGMGVFTGNDPTLPSQLWTAARLLQSLSFLLAPFFVLRRLNPYLLLAVTAAISSLLVGAIVGGIFPDAFGAGDGLTPFRMGGELVVCSLLLGALLLLRRRRAAFDPDILRLLTGVIALSIASELAFTPYFDAYAAANVIGHLLKVTVLYLAYKAFIETAFLKPYNLIFMRLKQNEDELLLANEELETRVRSRTSELDRTNEVLRAEVEERRKMAEEREHLQMQLVQSQKLESLGRLAGGVAHDFNNILTGIIGFSELLADRLPADAPERELADLIHNGGKRAAELTGQLLAFSRKQVLEMRPANLNRVVEEVSKLLARIIGEDVTLDIRLAEQMPNVLGDHGQLEQVLLNLAVNARDAMPGGGRLLIETVEVSIDLPYPATPDGVNPGRYALLTVTDNGEGMSREVQERIFEPFFTTKEQGKGTGLGLATVYGIVKQHNGHVWVYSEPGMGTSFKVYLPLIEGRVEREPAPSPAAQRGGDETVLVVDDEPFIRKLVMETLNPLGYETLEAASGDEALRLVEHFTGNVDLLLVDVIMPGMNGRQLAEILVARLPGLKVVYMSGYTDGYLTGNCLAEEEIVFLPKPFSPAKLTETLRSVFDEGIR